MIQGSNTYYFQYNAHGDVTGLTDSSGNTVATYTYDEFGNLKGSTGSIYNPLRYSGANNAYFDTETSLYKMGARYYDSSTGRWITRDKIQPAETEPETYHKYAFAKNNPLVYVDPTGLAYLKFNGRVSKLYHDSGRLWKGPYKTVTGYPKIGWRQKYIEGKQVGGPIPPGNWWTNKRQVLDNSDPNYPWSSWGRWRLGPLNYSGAGYGTYNRGGFYVHGGEMYNSYFPAGIHWTQGCIKTTNKFVHFLYDNLPKMSKKTLKVRVRYGKNGGVGSKSGEGNWYNGGYRYKEGKEGVIGTW